MNNGIDTLIGFIIGLALATFAFIFMTYDLNLRRVRTPDEGPMWVSIEDKVFDLVERKP